MSPLEFVKPDTSFSGMNVLLYGGPKTGKTVGACSAPAPVLLLNADTADAARFSHLRYGDKVREVRVTGRKVLDDAYLELREGSEFRSVVVDPVGEVHRVLLEERSGRAIRPKIQEYGDVSVELERFCRALCGLPVTTVLVAHETAVKDEESGRHERLPWTGTTNPALGAKLMAMVGVIAYCGVVEPEKDDQPLRFVGQLVNAAGRRGGDRTGTLGRFRDLDLSEWVTTANGAAGSKRTTKKKGSD